VTVSSIVVEQGRLPIEEPVGKDITATISAGNASMLPPIHIWGSNPMVTQSWWPTCFDHHHSDGRRFGLLEWVPAADLARPSSINCRIASDRDRA
jgi:hypothetical protein